MLIILYISDACHHKSVPSFVTMAWKM